MTREEMATLLQTEVKGLSSYLDAADYTNACDDAARETGWSFPLADTENERLHWQKTRAKRHLFFYLMSESAHKFRVKTLFLQHRFEHYIKLIEVMDRQWEIWKLKNPLMFLTPGEEYKWFGSKIDAGFSYDGFGRDTTYTDDNQIAFTPSDAS